MGKRRFWRGAVFALGLGLVGAAQAQALLTMGQFRDRVAERIAADHPGVKIAAIGENQLRVDVPGGQVMTATLDRAFGIYQGNPNGLQDILKGLSGSVRARRPAATPESLVLLVRPLASIPKPGLMTRSLPGGMAVVLAEDLPDSFEFPTSDELRTELGLEEGALWSRALTNTRAKIRIEPRRPNPERVTHISTGGYFASSLIADDAFWDSEPLSAEGPIVVAAFARDDIYIAPLKNAGAVDELRKLMATVRGEINGLTDDLIVRRNGRWEALR